MNYEKLVNRHKDAVYRNMIRYCGGHHDDAEDVLSEALLRAYRAAETLEDEDRFQAWLTTIGKRICIRLRRRDVALVDPADLENVVAPGVDAQTELERARTKAAVRGALGKLPPEFRQVIELRDLQGLSGEETAQRLGLTLSAQKSRLHRARKALRETLDREFSPDF